MDLITLHAALSFIGGGFAREVIRVFGYAVIRKLGFEKLIFLERELTYLAEGECPFDIRCANRAPLSEAWIMQLVNDHSANRKLPTAC